MPVLLVKTWDDLNALNVKKRVIKHLDKANSLLLGRSMYKNKTNKIYDNMLFFD